MKSPSLFTCFILAALAVSPVAFAQTTGTGTPTGTGQSSTQTRGTGVVSPGSGVTTSPGGTTVGGAVEAVPGVVAPGVETDATTTDTDVSEPEPGRGLDPVPGGAFLPGSAPAESRSNQQIDEPAGATATPAQAPTQPSVRGTADARSQSVLRTETQAQAIANQASSVLALGGTSSFFFPEANSVITIHSDNGVVTLRGDVGSQEQSQAISAAISGLPNVSQVNNELTVLAEEVEPEAEQESERLPLQPLRPVPGPLPGSEPEQ